MDDKAKTREQLVQELVGLRQEIARLEVAKGEHKRVEEALHESEEKWRLTVANAPLGIGTVSLNGKFISMNQPYCDMLGYSVDELLNLTFADITHPDDREKSSQAFNELQKGETKTVEFEKRYIRKDGSAVHVVQRGGIVRNSIGHPLFIVGITEDITERMRAEEATRLAHAELSQIFLTAADGMRVIDKDFNTVRINQAFSFLAGIGNDEAADKKCYEVFPGPACHTPSCSLTRILGGEERVEYEVEKERIDGIRVHCIVTATPFRQPGGELVGIVENLKDITERQRVEEALRESEERFRQFFENEPEYCYMISPEGIILEVNNAALKTLGYKKEELVGKPMGTIYAPESLLKMKQLFRRWLRLGALKDEEMVITTKEGNRRVVLLSAGVVKGEDGKPLHSVSVQKDITERQRAEEELRQLTHELGERVKELSCLYGISKLVENQDISLKGVLQGVVDLIPPAWRYPEITCARIAMDDKEFKTDNFETTEWMQTANIGAKRHKEGTIEVCYLQERPDIDEGPFLREERALIEAIAEVLGRVIERKRVEKTWRAFSRRLVEVQEGERRHIASELHDQIAQTLTELNLLLETARRRSGEKARAKLSEAQALISELMERVSSISLDLRPPMLDHLGLLPTLLWHFKRYAAQTQVRVDFMHTGLDGRFPPEVRLAAYRIVQEALTNVARHAGVREVRVRTWVDKDTLHVQVEDQGTGFNPEVALSAAVSSGLAGMHERAAWLGGKLVVESAPGVGTRVIAELPLEHPTEEVENEKGARRQ